MFRLSIAQIVELKWGENMSCDLWRYTEQCEGRPCPGDCDCCDFDPDEVTITPPTVDYKWEEFDDDL